VSMYSFIPVSPILIGHPEPPFLGGEVEAAF
jgi:hypothetical protein